MKIPELHPVLMPGAMPTPGPTFRAERNFFWNEDPLTQARTTQTLFEALQTAPTNQEGLNEIIDFFASTNSITLNGARNHAIAPYLASLITNKLSITDCYRDRAIVLKASAALKGLITNPAFSAEDARMIVHQFNYARKPQRASLTINVKPNALTTLSYRTMLKDSPPENPSTASIATAEMLELTKLLAAKISGRNPTTTALAAPSNP